MGIFSIALQAALGFAKAVISAKKGNLKTSVSLTKKTKDGKTTLKSMDELVYEVVQSAYGNYIRGKTTTMARFVGHPSVMLSPIEQLKLTMELYEPKIKCLIQENTTKKEEDIDVLDRIKEVGISYYSSYLKGLAGEQVIDKKYTLENLFTGKLTSEDMPDAITLLNMVAATKGAYYRGMYNGIKGIWDGGKMLVTETDKVLEGIYQSGSEFLEAPLKNTWEFLGDIKDGFIDSVWRSTPQEIAEDAGELAFDVAISVPTGGAGKVVSGAAKGIGKIKYLDNLVDIGKISQKIPSLQGMPLPAGEGFLPPNLADDFLKAPYQMIKPDGEDVAKLTAKGDDVVKQGAKEVKKPDTIDSQKIIKEKSGKETGSGVQITDSVNKTEVKDIVEKTEVKNTAEEPKVKDVKEKIDDEGRNATEENNQWSGNRGIYSVAYEVELPSDMYPGVSDARHFQEANRQLHNVFKADPEFAQQMETLYPGIIEGVKPGNRGAYPRRAPTKDVTWHHEATRKGILQLIPIEQHTAKGNIQSILHPQGKGGMENWGGGRTRRK